MDQFKHLDEGNMEQTPMGWVPAIPLPLYTHGKRLRRLRAGYQCSCLKTFNSEVEYQLHYRTAQMIEMNIAMSDQRAMWHMKATFWRRSAYIYRNGTPDEILRMEQMFDKTFGGSNWAEWTDPERMKQAEDTMSGQWAAVRQRRETQGSIQTDEKAEDQTADEAKGDFADPFTVVNSKGVTYYLNKKSSKHASGGMFDTWYLSRKFAPETAQRKLPDGYEVYETPRNGQMRVKRVSK